MIWEGQKEPMTHLCPQPQQQQPGAGVGRGGAVCTLTAAKRSWRRCVCSLIRPGTWLPCTELGPHGHEGTWEPP